MARLRAASGRLGADIRADNLRGDTGVPALSPLSLPSSPDRSRDRRRLTTKPRRRTRTFFRRWLNLSLKHTWATPLALILMALSGYLYNPTPSNPLHAAVFLSYPLEGKPGQPKRYGKGPRDLAFFAFYIVVFSFIREFLMQVFLRPLAIHYKIESRAKQSRFLEQMYVAIYTSILGPLALYIMSQTPIWYIRTAAFFEDFPHRDHEALFKAYYLLQASFWGQQAIVLMLQLEKPRKDFKELVGHHIITMALIGLSYRFHFTWMGLVVYMTHDISDFFLATSKTLSYINSRFVPPYFALFIGVWIYLRHYINLRILWATLTEFRTVGPYELNWETEQYKCPLSQVITFSLLASLQALNLFWLFLILRVAKNAVFSKTIVDERSDVEEEDEDKDKDQARLPSTDTSAPAAPATAVPLTEDGSISTSIAQPPALPAQPFSSSSSLSSTDRGRELKSRSKAQS